MSQPSNFSWLIEGLLAGSGYPSEKKHFEYFHSQGIQNVVNLTQYENESANIPQGMNIIFMPMKDFTPPTLKQIKDFVAIVDRAEDNKEAVVCHCQWGQGRTGTMLACYLVKRDRLRPQQAIESVRTARPRSIETADQEQAVFEYADTLTH